MKRKCNTVKSNIGNHLYGQMVIKIHLAGQLLMSCWRKSSKKSDLIKINPSLSSLSSLWTGRGFLYKKYLRDSKESIEHSRSDNGVETEGVGENRKVKGENWQVKVEREKWADYMPIINSAICFKYSWSTVSNMLSCSLSMSNTPTTLWSHKSCVV